MLISREARVGIVVGLALMTLAIAILFFRNVRATKGEYTVTVRLDDAGGIMEGAEVQFAGVRKGTVRKVDVEGDKAILTLGIHSDVNLYSNYDFAVRSGALLGERYVIITPKSRKRGEAAELLKDYKGPPIEGTEPSSVEELLPETKKLMSNFSVLISDLRGVVKNTDLLVRDLHDSTAALKNVMADPQTQRAVKGTMANLYETSEVLKRVAASPQIQGTLANVNRATQSLDQMTKSATQLVKRTDEVMQNVNEMVGFFKDVAKTNKENLDKTFAALPEMMKELKDTTTELKRAVQGVSNQENMEQLNAALKSIRQATDNLAHITEDVQKLTNDPKMQTDVKTMLSNLNETTQSAKKAVENLEATSASLRELATDKQLQSDLKETIHTTKETVATAKQTLEEGKQTLSEGRQVLSRVNKILGGGGQTAKVQPDLRFYRLPESNRYVSDFDLRISSGKKNSFVLGLHDVTESDKFTLQYAPAVGSLGSARLGVYRGKVGAGFDLMGRNGWLSLNAYNPNDLTGNIWGGYRLFGNWQLMVGVEGLGHPRAQTAVGVRVTK